MVGVIYVVSLSKFSYDQYHVIWVYPYAITIFVKNTVSNNL